MPEPSERVAGKYRLIRRIGEGGMATVWEAEHETLQTRVALKFIGEPSPMLGSADERFIEEARAAARIKHRNVIQVLDFGTAEDGTPFMVMELLEGDSLADRIEAEAPMPVEEVVRLGAQMLSALGAVHERGIVHRDLKPENVLFARDTDGSYVKLVDFGISKIRPADRSGRRPKTRQGLVLGTPQYMAPEQAVGSSDVDPRADLYAVGVILYEMLTGERPYDFADDEETMQPLLRRVIVGGAPGVEELRADVPSELAAWVAEAMAPARDERFQDAASMRAALLASVQRGADARSPSPADRGPRRPEREPADEPDATAAPKDDPALEPTVAVPAELDAASHPASDPASDGSGAYSGAPALLGPAGGERPARRPVELPDPRPMPTPSRWGRRLGAIVILALLAGALAAPELLSRGWYPRTIDRVRLATGNDPLFHTIDAGPARPDAGDAIWVRLSGVPEGASLLLDDVPVSDVEALRRPDGIVALPVPKKRAAFEVRVQAEGFEDWSVRRWPIQDFDLRVILRRGR